MKASETAIRSVLDYHELTKHQLDRYAPGPGYMDWETNPVRSGFMKVTIDLLCP